MPLHLLGKKSWNVYNPANIAKVKADEAAAAAREAADEQRMQEVDAERRAAILRGQTPPPLPDEETHGKEKRIKRADKDKDGHDRKRRRLAGEDDTDRDIRLARTFTEPGEEETIRTLKLRKPKSDAPLTDHAGNINLFPVDLKEAVKRDKNAEVEAEKKRKEQAMEDQYTMRFSNAAGREGLEKPWYANASSKTAAGNGEVEDKALEYSGFESKNVWGREDPRRKEREKARMTSSDPLAFMNQAQSQLKRSKEDKKRWANERERELMELRAAEEREKRRDRHGKRKKRHDDDELDAFSLDDRQHRKERSSRHRHRSRSRSRERSHARRPSHRYEQQGRSRSRERDHRIELKADHRHDRYDR